MVWFSLLFVRQFLLPTLFRYPNLTQCVQLDETCILDHFGRWRYGNSISCSQQKIVDLTTGFDQKRPFLRLLQLLWGTNEAIAQRLACSLRLSKPEPEFGQSLSQTLSQLATRASSTYLGRFTLAPQVRAPVPAFEFHLQSLAEEKVPPESWSLRIGKGLPVW